MDNPKKTMNPVKRLMGYQQEYKDVNSECLTRIHSNPDKASTAKYVEYCLRNPVNPRTVLYESYAGRAMVDNPFAIFKYLLKDERYADLEHVWIVSDLDNPGYKMSAYSEYPNVKLVMRNTDEYYKYLATAGYLINNVTFPPLFNKREGQVYVNTWHGTPLKSMGYEMAGGNLQTRNMVRNFLHTDYLIAANDILKDMYLKSYKLENLYPGTIIEEGYPRNDLLFDADHDELFKELEYYGVEFDRKKKIILYAPTWKQTAGQSIIVDARELAEFKKTLEKQIDSDRYQVLIKPHQMLYEEIKDDPNYKGIMIPSMIDANEILSAAEILISDFSSIFLDYMALDRPILFFVTNLDDYIVNRGMSMSIDEMPGPVTGDIQTIAEFIGNLDQIREEYADKYRKMKNLVCPYDDGKATARVVDCVFGKAEGYRTIKTTFDKKKLLISGGLLRENGISNSMISLLKQIDYDKFDVTLFVANDYSNKNMMRRLNEDIDPHVRVLVKTGPIAQTAREETRRIMTEHHGLYERRWKRIYPEKSLEREFHRIFGDADFDYVADFNGYGTINAKLLTKSKTSRKAIWLHNDILADMHRTVNGEQPLLQSLSFVLSVFPEYDALVSCAKSVMEVNRSNLATPKTKDKFTYAKNTTNADRVRTLKEEKPVSIDGKDYIVKEYKQHDGRPSGMTLLELPDSAHTNFVTMGRFSTEKNHENLIKAFNSHLKNYPDSRLYIIGTGPLEKKIKRQIAKLGLEDKVILTGVMFNPFVLMKRCDCFILPSIHEGQPLVLLEARQCGLPIIVSDFSTVRDSLIPDGQYVIHSDVKSIRKGLKAFREGKVPKVDFDIDKYNKEAYEEFVNAICGEEQ